MGYGYDDDGAYGGGGEAVEEAVSVADNVKLGENPAADYAADESENDVGDAAEAAAAGNFSGEPAGEQAEHQPADQRARFDWAYVLGHLQQRCEHEVSLNVFGDAFEYGHSSAKGRTKSKKAEGSGGDAEKAKDNAEALRALRLAEEEAEANGLLVEEA